jgi:hypothetical protein
MDALRGTLEKNIKELRRRIAEEVRKGQPQRARHLAYVDVRDKDYAQRIITEIAPELTDRTLILPLADIPVHGILDDVYFINGAKGLLNAQRFKEGDYGAASLSLEEETRLGSFLGTIFDLSSLSDNPQEVIAAILKGVVTLRIRPIDFQTIQDYHDRQVEVMRSL